MNSPNHLHQKADDIVTFSLKRSTASRLIARLIVTMSLAAITSYLLIQSFTKQYEKGQSLTQETYLKDFEKYKQSLLTGRDYTNNIPLTSFISLMTISFLVGSYELLVLGIGLIIGKIIKS
jgi:hypothetical protein